MKRTDEEDERPPKRRQGNAILLYTPELLGVAGEMPGRNKADRQGGKQSDKSRHIGR
jgi:hypothetical protein